MRVVVAMWLALAVAGCAAPQKPDAYCKALREFANASSGPQPRTVVLTSGRVFEVTEDEIVMARKDCKQDGVYTGKGMCAYLLKYGFTEFPQWTFVNAARCLGLPQQKPLASGDYAPVSSRQIAGRRLRTQLEISYSRPIDGSRPIFTVTARKVP